MEIVALAVNVRMRPTAHALRVDQKFESRTWVVALEGFERACT